MAETTIEQNIEKRAGSGGAATPSHTTMPEATAQPSMPLRVDDLPEVFQPEGSSGMPRANFASRIKRTQLANGATLLVLENHATPTVSVRGALHAGSYFEPRDRPGLASITADMLERGTKRRSKIEIADQLERVGAQVDFSSGHFAVNIGARSLAKDLPHVIQTLTEELRESSFPIDELEKLKQQEIASIQEQQANTRYRAYERFTELVFDPTHPFFIPPGEKLIESISAITADDIQSFYTEQYGGRSLILVVVGDVESKEVEQQFRESFSDFTGPEKIEVKVSDPTPKKVQREVVFLKDKASIDVVIGRFAPLRRTSEDYYAAMIANRALGESTLSSRLGLQVRDKEGLTYGINSRFRSPSLAAGPWSITASVSPENVERIINSALNVLRDYIEHGIGADELADEKSSTIGSFKVSLSTNAGLAEALWHAEFYKLGTDYIDRYPQIMRAVTAEEVNAASHKYLRPDELTVVIAGDFKDQ
ncbi:MAG: insulinase family protein [Pyrinomonadaceae bacterium]|nr:insulinase family protein [Pyrinomonadaceae bacterium]